MKEKKGSRFTLQDIFTNKKKAVALSYQPDKHDAPKVIASGQGYLAERILETAKSEEIPIHQDSQLTETLSKLEVGEHIPPELYKIVAEILIYVDSMDRLKGKVMKDE